MRVELLCLNELLQITEEISSQANSIQSNMNHNRPEQLETVQLLIEKRESVIKQLDAYMKQSDLQWTNEDKLKLRKLRTLEQSIQPLMRILYQSFLKQMNRINQTKQASKKYFGAFQHMTTDGVFIDKRK